MASAPKRAPPNEAAQGRPKAQEPLGRRLLQQGGTNGGAGGEKGTQPPIKHRSRGEAQNTHHASRRGCLDASPALAEERCPFFRGGQERTRNRSTDREHKRLHEPRQTQHRAMLRGPGTRLTGCACCATPSTSSGRGESRGAPRAKQPRGRAGARGVDVEAAVLPSGSPSGAVSASAAASERVGGVEGASRLRSAIIRNLEATPQPVAAQEDTGDDDVLARATPLGKAARSHRARHRRWRPLQAPSPPRTPVSEQACGGLAGGGRPEHSAGVHCGDGCTAMQAARFIGHLLFCFLCCSFYYFLSPC